MAKRRFIFSDSLYIQSYKTDDHGWTVTAWELEEAEAVTDYVDIPGRINGPLDLSNVLTDGLPTYGNRQLSITLESSEGTRADRILEIKKLEKLTGFKYIITTPEYEDIDAFDLRRLYGRLVSVKTNYNDLAHAQVSMTFVCEPYYTPRSFRTYTLTAGTTELANNGDRPAVPLLSVKGVTDSITLSIPGKQWSLSNGTYTLPGLIIPHDPIGVGILDVTVTGTGTITLQFKEGYL